MKTSGTDNQRRETPQTGSQKGSQRRRPSPGRKGVTLISPTTNRPLWRARYRDPETGKLRHLTPDPQVMRTKEGRDLWAERFAETLGRRRGELQSGAPRRVGKPLKDAVDGYFKEHEPRLSPRTVAVYREASDAFSEWAVKQGIDDTADIQPEHLYQWRSHLAGVRKRAPAKGGKAGQRRKLAERRAPGTTNRLLRAMATVLQVWRKAGLLPQLHSDDIKDRLEQLPVHRDVIDFLTADQCQQLLRACLGHDKANVRKSRPIAPFTIALLLGGFRLGEALGLTWDQVHLDQGLIRLPPASTKTRIGRRVRLTESPALAELLEALKAASDGDESVFGQTESGVQLARARLIKKYGAPQFTWEQLRRTCATFSWNMPGSIPHKAAKRAGHSVTMAEGRYADLVEVPRDARTLEAAMGIEAEANAAV